MERLHSDFAQERPQSASVHRSGAHQTGAFAAERCRAGRGRPARRGLGRVEQLQYPRDGAQVAVPRHEGGERQVAAPLGQTVARPTSNAAEDGTRRLFHIPWQ